jgi:DUF971 family protein
MSSERSEDRLTPATIRQLGPRELEILWTDGHASRYAVSYLRRACRCADCIDEWTGRRTLDPAKVADGVKPVRIEQVGRYAVHFEWSDGHSTGIYSFDYLRDICPCAECEATRRAAGDAELECRP